jgi:hypothetical protein
MLNKRLNDLASLTKIVGAWAFSFHEHTQNKHTDSCERCEILVVGTNVDNVNDNGV